MSIGSTYLYENNFNSKSFYARLIFPIEYLGLLLKYFVRKAITPPLAYWINKNFLNMAVWNPNFEPFNVDYPTFSRIYALNSKNIA